MFVVTQGCPHVVRTHVRCLSSVMWGMPPRRSYPRTGFRMLVMISPSVKKRLAGFLMTPMCWLVVSKQPPCTPVPAYECATTMVDHEPPPVVGVGGEEETTVVNARPHLGTAGQGSCIGTTWLHTGVRRFLAFGVQYRQSDHLSLRAAASSWSLHLPALIFMHHQKAGMFQELVGSLPLRLKILMASGRTHRALLAPVAQNLRTDLILFAFMVSTASRWS